MYYSEDFTSGNRILLFDNTCRSYMKPWDVFAFKECAFPDVDVIITSLRMFGIHTLFAWEMHTA